MKSTAETVKQALEDAKKAQAAAEKAIQQARADIGETEDRLAQVLKCVDTICMQFYVMKGSKGNTFLMFSLLLDRV